MTQRKLALVGMMASGKTRLGKALAVRLGVPFVDSDHEMIAAAGMSVAEYFARHGEAAFREMERETVVRLLARPGSLVLSLGGGAYLQAEIRELLRADASSIFLKVELPEIIRRLETGDIGRRPLLAAAPDWRVRVAELMAERQPVYLEADIVFDAGRRDIDALASELAELVL